MSAALGAFPHGVSGDDEFADPVVLVEVDGAGFFAGGEFPSTSAVAVGIGAQVVERRDDHVAVPGQVERDWMQEQMPGEP